MSMEECKMKLTEKQIEDLKEIYTFWDDERHTASVSKFLRIDARIQGMISTLRILGVSLDDFEKILNVK